MGKLTSSSGSPIKNESPFQGLLREMQREIGLAGGNSTSLFRVLVRMFDAYIQHRDLKTSFMGIYILHKDILVLGPHVGPPTVHDIIPISRGVVGKCADEGKVINVPDVSSCSYYLSCCESVRSEIVIPIFTGNSEKIGVLDLDSEKVRAYTNADEKELTQIAAVVAQPCVKLADRLRLNPEW